MNGKVSFILLVILMIPTSGVLAQGEKMMWKIPSPEMRCLKKLLT